MSKNFKGYMGDQIGKLGTAVGRRWKGKMVYSAYQGKVSNPNTEAQQLVRARFAVLGKMASAFLSTLQLGLKRWAVRLRLTEGDVFVKTNYAAVEGESADALTVGYDQLAVAQGPLTGVQFGSAVFTTPLTPTVPIAEGNVGVDGAKSDDKVYLVAYSPDKQKAVRSTTPVSRSDANATVSVPASWQGLKVHLYGFVQSASDKTLVSDSEYIGFGNIG